MKRCPQCRECVQSVYLSGWVVKAEFPVTFAAFTTDVVETGAAVVHAHVDPSRQESWKDFQARCPECDYTGKLTEFEDVLPCVLSLAATQTSVAIEVPYFKKALVLPIAPEMRERARRLFDLYNPFADESGTFAQQGDSYLDEEQERSSSPSRVPVPHWTIAPGARTGRTTL